MLVVFSPKFWTAAVFFPIILDFYPFFFSPDSNVCWFLLALRIALRRWCFGNFAKCSFAGGAGAVLRTRSAAGGAGAVLRTHSAAGAGAVLRTRSAAGGAGAVLRTGSATGG